MAKKILVIDDDPVIVKYLVNLFEDNGYATCTASSSMEGLEAHHPGPPNASGVGPPFLPKAQAG